MSSSEPPSTHDELLASIRGQLLRRDAITLPPVPDVAADLMRLTAGDDPSFSEIGAAASRDPVVAAKLIGLANSAFFRGRREFNTVEETLVRLGTTVVRAFAVGLAAGSLVRMPQSWSSLRGEMWNQCIATSVGARMIAQQMDAGQVDLVFLGGLFHDVGYLVTLHLALQSDEEPAADAVVSVLDELRVEAGEAILAHWQVPTVYRRLLTPGDRIAQQSDLHTSALIIEYASDASRALGHGPTVSEPIDLVEHPLGKELGVSKGAIAKLQEELVSRVDELTPLLGH